MPYRIGHEVDLVSTTKRDSYLDELLILILKYFIRDDLRKKSSKDDKVDRVAPLIA